MRHCLWREWWVRGSDYGPGITELLDVGKEGIRKDDSSVPDLNNLKSSYIPVSRCTWCLVGSLGVNMKQFNDSRPTHAVRHASYIGVGLMQRISLPLDKGAALLADSRGLSRTLGYAATWVTLQLVPRSHQIAGTVILFFFQLPRRMGGITIKSTPLTVQGIPRPQLIESNKDSD